MLVRDYLDLPTKAHPDDFIVRPQSDELELARTYTLTTAIRSRFEALLRDVKAALDRNEDLGRFVFGSFGSGKSHFLRIAGMLLCGDGRLAAHARDEGLRALRAAYPWLDDARLLVVHASMISVNEQASAFTRALATEFDRTLEAAGKPPLRAFGAAAAFAAFDRLSAESADLFNAFERKTGYTRAFYDEQRRAADTGADVGAFAREIARFLGDERQFEPTDSEAREQMARHAHALGYRAVVFAIDEFVLWIQGLSSEGYAAAVNALNALVESAEVKPARFIVLAAIQRSIASVFPEDRTEHTLRDQLARVKDRFPDLYLEDSNIFEIAERRVLTPKADRADDWRREVGRVVRDLADAKGGVLIGDEPPAALAQLYPFHPALMRVLSDVSQGLHRARSSLFMLYQLLTEVRPALEIGQLMSLGALWDVLFSDEHRASLENYAPKNDPTHHANRLLKTYATWERLSPSIARVGEDGRNAKMLDIAVKAALLAQLSHTRFLDEVRGLDQAVTVENLFRLNRTDIAAMNDAVGVKRLEDLFQRLAAAEPGTVMLDGGGPAAIVRIELNAIDVNELLAALRPPSLYPTMLAQVKQALGLTAIGASEGRLAAPFRGTERNGRVRFEALEQLTASGRESTLALEGGDEFKLAVAIEADFGGSAQQQIDNARARIESARDQAQGWSIAWLPGPLSDEGRAALETLAKASLFLERPDEYLARFRAGEHALVRQRMEAMRSNAQVTLQAALKLAYGDGARVPTMRNDPSELLPPNVDVALRAKHFATALLERKYPQHPKFGAAPNPVQLTKVLAVERRLQDDPTDNALAGEDVDVVKKLGEPLELFEPGVGVTNQKAGGLYLERLGEAVLGGERRVANLLERFAREPLGLQRPVVQLLVAVLALRQGYRILVDGRPVAIASVADVVPQAELARSPIPPVATWTAARSAAIALFNVTGVPPALNVNSVDALVQACHEPLALARAALQTCGTKLTDVCRECGVDASQAADAYAAAQRDLSVLSGDDHFLDRLVKLDVEQLRKVLSAARDDATQLTTVVAYPQLKGVIGASDTLRTKLRALLTAADLPLSPNLVAWMNAAQDFVAERLRGVGPEPPRPPGPGPEPVTVSAGPPPLSRRLPLPLREADLAVALAEFQHALNEAGVTSGEIVIQFVGHIPGDGETL